MVCTTCKGFYSQKELKKTTWTSQASFSFLEEWLEGQQKWIVNVSNVWCWMTSVLAEWLQALVCWSSKQLACPTPQCKPWIRWASEGSLFSAAGQCRRIVLWFSSRKFKCIFSSALSVLWLLSWLLLSLHLSFSPLLHLLKSANQPCYFIGGGVLSYYKNLTCLI